MWIVPAMYLLLIPLTAVYLNKKGRAGDKKPAIVIIKGAVTLVIVLAALAGLTLRSGGVSPFDWLIVMGLALGLAGDVAISVSLLGGMAAFALGHLCYIGAILSVPGNHAPAVPLWAVMYAAMYFIYKKSGIKPGKFEIPSYIYAAVIFTMVSLSFTVKDSRPFLPPAAVLFAASDFMLAFLMFGGKPNKTLDSVSLWCYFIGQSLFAVSVIIAL